MCESGKRCYEGESCGTRVDQLKRCIWVLMIWVFVLSLGLGASMTFQIILHQSPHDSTDGTVRTRSQLTLYDCFDKNEKDEHEVILWWKEKNGDYNENNTIKIEDDGNYFLFLTVTLQSHKQGVNYTIMVKKTTVSNDSAPIIAGHIKETENSTGFMGKGEMLARNTLISVICRPPAKVDVRNSYLGLVKF